MPEESDTILRGLLELLIRRYPGWVVGAIALVTLLFGYGAQRITVSSDLTNFFAEDDQQAMLFTETTELFGGTSYVLAAVEADQVFSVSGLKALDELTQHLSFVEGVESVRSITNVEEIRGSDWGIEVSPMLSELPQDEEEVQAFERKVREDSQLAGRLVSEDGRYTLVLIELESGVDKDTLVNDIRAAVEEARGSLAVYLTGNPVLTQVMNESLLRDLSWLSPLVILLIVGILFVSFRNWQGVLLPLLTMITSTIWTLGLMG